MNSLLFAARPPAALRVVWLLATGVSVTACARNLLPNPGFEEGTAAPAGWRLSDAALGQWSSEARQGRRAISVHGEGKSSSFWRTERLPLRPGGLYRLSFWGRKDAGTGGGCAVAGTGRVNRDFRLSDSWQRYSFVFSVPDDGTNDYVRLGQWEVRGRLHFDDVELVPVQAVHDELAEGERIENGVYRFQPNFGWAGANYHRPLVLNRAGFNSDRWVFSAGSEVIYRVPARTHPGGGARLRVNVNYHTAGRLLVEASRDRQSWTRVAEYDGSHRSGRTNLPAALLPAEALFVRLSLSGPGNLQVNACDYEADLEPAGAAWAEGRTQLIEILTNAPQLAVELKGSGPRQVAGQVSLAAHVSNRTERPLTLRATLTADTPGAAQTCTLEARQTVVLTPAVQPREPGRFEVQFRIENDAGQTLYQARTEAKLSFLDDPRPGYWLTRTDNLQIWWAESGWKLGGHPPAREDPAPVARTPVRLSAARGEFEPVQVFLAGRRAPEVLQSLAVGPFLNARGESAPITVRVSEAVPVLVRHPTDGSCERGAYPDPLPPLQTPLPVPAGSSRTLWITVHVPRETRPGDYSGELKLTISGVPHTFPLAVHVYDFELPRETHLRSGFGLGTGSINRYHKLGRPEDRQLVFEKYLKNFAEHRISPYSFFDYAPIDLKFVGQGADKQAQMDFTKFDAAAARWIDEYKFNAFRLPLRGMGGGTFHSRHLGELEGFKEGTPEFARLFNDYLGQVTAHLRARGWLDEAYTYWFDEPDRKDYEFVVDGMKRIKAAAPGLKRMLTEQPEPELFGHVDIWCGLTPEWTPEKVAARRAAGEEVWWYLCTGPKAPFVTIFIDHPGTEMRLWPWQSWQYGVQGILVWQTTYWTSGAAFPDQLQDPWSDPMSYVSGYDFKPGQVGYWGNGDGRFLYPPRRDPNTATEPCRDEPINSVRWENLRDGMEDYEYFWLLDQQVKRLERMTREASNRGRPNRETERLLAEAKQLLVVPEAISKDLTHFTNDPRLMLEHRDKLARMIETLRKR